MKYPFLALCLVAPMAIFAAPTPSQSPSPSVVESREKNVPPDLVDQIDTTDVFAVPLDTSEEEEDVEEAKLEKMQKKLEQKKTTPATSPAPTQTPSQK